MGRLTAARVRALKSPGKYHDQHGLILRVAPGGSKQWIWRGTVRGRRRDLGLGAVAYTSLAEARDIAYQYRKLARSGGDPASLRPDSSVPTFTECIELVIDIHRGGWKDGGKIRGELAVIAAALRLPADRLDAVSMRSRPRIWCGCCVRSGTTRARRPARSRPGWA